MCRGLTGSIDRSLPIDRCVAKDVLNLSHDGSERQECDLEIKKRIAKHAPSSRIRDDHRTCVCLKSDLQAIR